MTVPTSHLTSRRSASISPIEDILKDFAGGRMVILVDDEARENEGDLLVAAEIATAEHINFMATHGRGLICLSISEERSRKLKLPRMVQENTSRYATAFTVSVEAARNVSTGISAFDRATTIKAAVAPNAESSDLVTPGHVFPIIAEPGGVLTRAGHTEAGSDLAKLSGFEPASVLCEILKEDGTMARLEDLVEFGQRHNIKIGTIADLISYRLTNESTVERQDEVMLQTDYGKVKAISFLDQVRGNTHLALVHGNIVADEPTILRVHVFTGLFDVIDSIIQGACSWSVRKAIERIMQESSGAVILLNYQRDFTNLAEAKRESESDSGDVSGSGDIRIIGIGCQIAADLGFGKLRVLGHQRRLHALSGFGLSITEYIEPASE